MAIRPIDSTLTNLIKTDVYGNLIRSISDQYSIMDKFINNLNTDINEVGGLIKELERDAGRGYDVGTSLDTLGFQKETLSLDRDFFTNQKNTYLKKIYQDLFKYTDGIILKCIQIENNTTGATDEEIRLSKFGRARIFKETPIIDPNNPDNQEPFVEEEYNINDIYVLLGVTEQNLKELASDIATFKERIASAEEKEKRGFSVGNIILNLKEQETTLKLSFTSYCLRLEQFLSENLKFAKKCVKRVELISGEIVTQEELEQQNAQNNNENIDENIDDDLNL